ncbi:MAG: hypothetical protein KDC98_04845 [Planctomycetes bacterium]|nr:hypothetical protein [Planctomycetota bacterium]
MRPTLLRILVPAILLPACHPTTRPSAAAATVSTAEADVPSDAVPCLAAPRAELLTARYEAMAAQLADRTDLFGFVEASMFGLLSCLPEDRFVALPDWTPEQPELRVHDGRIVTYRHVLEIGSCRWRVTVDRAEAEDLFCAWEELL